MPANVKHPPPARVRPKVGSKRNRNALLALGQKYISGQSAADPQGKLATQATAVGTTRTALVALLTKKADLTAQLDANQGAIVIADAQYGEAIAGYASAAAAYVNGDASLLANLGVDAASNPTKPGEPVGTAVLTIKPGAQDGDAVLKCRRVPKASAYLFEYKLEPSQPTDPWLGNFTTKLASVTVPGLAPAQAIRGRVRAIGVTPGPWSVEVVGRAK